MAADLLPTAVPPSFGGAFDVVALASSVGGLRALTAVLTPLPVEFPAAILIVHHLDPRGRSVMDRLLARSTRLSVHEAREADHLLPGHVFIAPPDWHMRVTAEGSVSLSQSNPVNFVRPSADHLFESVGESYGRRAIAVVLTGRGQDGTRGIAAIKRHGGVVIAQDRDTSEMFGMPGSAAETGLVDHVLSLQDIGSALIRLVVGGPDNGK